MKSGWAAVILIVAGIVAYANTAKNGLFWDDDEFITRNAYIRSFRYLPEWFSRPMTAGAGVNSNYYRPLLQLSFAIDYKLWGLWPVGYHLENMFWHIAAGILLFFFLSSFISVVSSEVERPSRLDSSARRKLLARNDGGTGNIIAFAASLLWLVHPVHVEAVAYANSRGDSMATVFILLSLVLWLKQRFWASSAVFVLALLSKEFAIVTPGLIILLEFMKHQIPNAKSQTISKSQSQNSKQARQSGSLRNFQSYIDDRRSSLIYITNLASKKLYRLLTIVVNLYNFIKPILLYITIAVIYLVLRLTVLNFQNTLNFYGVDLSKVNQSQPLARYATSLPARLMTFLKVLPIYARILVWPDDLHMERTVEIAAIIKGPVVLSSLAVILALAGFFGWALIFSSRKLAGTSEPRSHALREREAGGLRREVSVLPGSILVFALAWFFISILPVSGIIPISQILAEHFLYLPSIGFFLIVGWLIISGLNQISLLLKIGRLNDSNHLTLVHLVYWVILLGISIPLITKTVSQNRIWRDPITFYEYTLAHAKPTARVYNNLAMAYADVKENQKAIDNYQLAIGLGDIYPNPHYNLGNALMEMGELDEAEREYRRALEIDPQFHYATLKLGQMYLDQGKIDDAKNLVCPVFPTQPLCR